MELSWDVHGVFNLFHGTSMGLSTRATIEEHRVFSEGVVA